MAPVGYFVIAPRNSAKVLLCNTYALLFFLTDAVEQKTGRAVYRTAMDQVNNTLPSKEAQYSSLGLKLGRQKMTRDRGAVQRRRSTIKTNQVRQNKVLDDVFLLQ